MTDETATNDADGTAARGGDEPGANDPDESAASDGGESPTTDADENATTDADGTTATDDADEAPTGRTTGFQPGSTVIARTVARTVVPLVLVTAVALLLRGHNLPGGGFIAGVLTATAFALVYVVYGLDTVEERMLGETPDASAVDHLRHGAVEVYRALFALGLLVAAGSGVVAMAFDRPFLTQTFRVLHDLPLFGEMEIASALAFDVGVYLVVLGALLTVVSVVGAE